MKSIFASLTVLVVLFLASAISLTAQEGDTTYWKKGGVANLGFTNAGYSTYWQAGGIPSQSASLRLNLYANYEQAKTSWQNDLALVYGLLRQGSSENPFIKNEDRIELNSKYGYKVSDKAHLTGLLNFRTQFAPGFSFDPKQPTTIPTDTISDFLAPAYLNFGLGLDYRPSEDLNINYSPVNSKMTIVTVAEYQALYNPEADAFRYELGSNLAIKYRKALAENLLLQSNAVFFANYLQNFGNIDVNWETLTTLKVKKWLAVTFATNLVYDDDIKFVIERDTDGNATKTGPRTQFQHVLSVGLTYQFLK
ncbi:MAG: DUF3078 domain-containing protein [Bacteroidia bacterium]|nr:DUF3078 domain-containing protein [Bacteroidia bacterium]